MTDTPRTPQIGDAYLDLDPRAKGRTLMVLDIVGGFGCRVVNVATGKETTMLARRLSTTHRFTYLPDGTTGGRGRRPSVSPPEGTKP